MHHSQTICICTHENINRHESIFFLFHYKSQQQINVNLIFHEKTTPQIRIYLNGRIHNSFRVLVVHGVDTQICGFISMGWHYKLFEMEIESVSDNKN